MQRVWKTLAGRYGEVIDVVDDVIPTGVRRLRFVVALPGYVEAAEATIILAEQWDASPHAWSLAAYRCDYLREPKGTGRKAHHWHRIPAGPAVFHAHCEDPEPIHPHYRDVEVTMLEAADEFARIHASGELRCEDLFPALRLSSADRAVRRCPGPPPRGARARTQGDTG